MESDKKEILFTPVAGASKSEKRSKAKNGIGNPSYGCLKGGTKPTYRQFTRRSSVDENRKPAIPPTTYKHYRKCGRIGNNTVRVLLSDQKTMAGLERDKKKLDKHTLATVCDYLAKRNLYRSGSDAPEEVLREIYRNAHLAGNVHNNDPDILINNFMKGSGEV